MIVEARVDERQLHYYGHLLHSEWKKWLQLFRKVDAIYFAHLML